MGRLTLNVLLSFAQFEREVTKGDSNGHLRVAAGKEPTTAKTRPR